MNSPMVINSNTLLSLIDLNKDEISISTELSSLSQNGKEVTTMIDSTVEFEVAKGVCLTLFVFASVKLDEVDELLQCTRLDHNIESVGFAMMSLQSHTELVIECDGDYYTLDEVCNLIDFKSEIINSKLLGYDAALVNRLLSKAFVNANLMAFA